MKKTHTIAKAIGQSPRKNAEYMAARKLHTDSCIIKTSKPRKSKPKQKDIEALRDRAESVEGSEVPEIAFNEAETPLRTQKAEKECGSEDKAESMPSQGFNGS